MPAHAMTNTLRQQELEIREVFDTIHENINQQRSDLRFCLPELREVLIGLMQEHYSDTDHLANELGVAHEMVLYWDLRLDQLVDEANEAIQMTDIMLGNDKDLDGDVAITQAHSEAATHVPTKDTMQPRTEILMVSELDTMQATMPVKTTMQPRTEVTSLSKKDTMQPKTEATSESVQTTMQPRTEVASLSRKDTMQPKTEVISESVQTTMQPRTEITSLSKQDTGLPMVGVNTESKQGTMQSMRGANTVSKQDTGLPMMEVNIGSEQNTDLPMTEVSKVSNQAAGQSTASKQHQIQRLFTTVDNETMEDNRHHTPADAKPAALTMFPETQKVQVSIVKTKDVALNLPVGYEATGGTPAEADTATKLRQAADTRKHPAADQHSGSPSQQAHSGPAVSGDDNDGPRQHGHVHTHQKRKLLESCSARESPTSMSLLVATFIITALMVGLIPAGRYPANVAKHETGKSAGPGIGPWDAGYTLFITMEPMSKHKEKKLKQGFTSLMEYLPPLPSSKQQQAILYGEQSNHNHPTVQPGKQDLEEQNSKNDVKMHIDVGFGEVLTCADEEVAVIRVGVHTDWKNRTGAEETEKTDDNKQEEAEAKESLTSTSEETDAAYLAVGGNQRTEGSATVQGPPACPRLRGQDPGYLVNHLLCLHPQHSAVLRVRGQLMHHPTKDATHTEASGSFMCDRIFPPDLPRHHPEFLKNIGVNEESNHTITEAITTSATHFTSDLSFEEKIVPCLGVAEHTEMDRFFHPMAKRNSNKNKLSKSQGGDRVFNLHIPCKESIGTMLTHRVWIAHLLRKVHNQQDGVPISKSPQHPMENKKNEIMHEITEYRLTYAAVEDPGKIDVYPLLVVIDFTDDWHLDVDRVQLTPTDTQWPSATHNHPLQHAHPVDVGSQYADMGMMGVPLVAELSTINSHICIDDIGQIEQIILSQNSIQHRLVQPVGSEAHRNQILCPLALEGEEFRVDLQNNHLRQQWVQLREATTDMEINLPLSTKIQRSEECNSLSQKLHYSFMISPFHSPPEVRSHAKVPVTEHRPVAKSQIVTAEGHQLLSSLVQTTCYLETTSKSPLQGREEPVPLHHQSPGQVHLLDQREHRSSSSRRPEFSMRIIFRVLNKGIRGIPAHQNKSQLPGSSHHCLQVQIIGYCEAKDTAYQFIGPAQWIPSSLEIRLTEQEQQVRVDARHDGGHPVGPLQHMPVYQSSLIN